MIFFKDLPLICRHFIKNNEKKKKRGGGQGGWCTSLFKDPCRSKLPILLICQGMI